MMLQCYFKEDTLFLKVEKAGKTLGVSIASADLQDGDKVANSIAELIDRLLKESYGLTRFDLINTAYSASMSHFGFTEDSVLELVGVGSREGDAETGNIDVVDAGD